MPTTPIHHGTLNDSKEHAAAEPQNQNRLRTLLRDGSDRRLSAAASVTPTLKCQRLPPREGPVACDTRPSPNARVRAGLWRETCWCIAVSPASNTRAAAPAHEAESSEDEEVGWWPTGSGRAVAAAARFTFQKLHFR